MILAQKILFLNFSQRGPCFVFFLLHNFFVAQLLQQAHFLMHNSLKALTSEIVLLFQRSNIWAMPCKNMSSGIWGQQRPRLACASVQSDQGLHGLLTESLDTTECMNRE